MKYGETFTAATLEVKISNGCPMILQIYSVCNPIEYLTHSYAKVILCVLVWSSASRVVFRMDQFSIDFKELI